MILKEFNIKELNLNYFVGLGQIEFNFKEFLNVHKISENKVIDKILEIIENLQKNNEDISVQFINDSYIINQEHVFTACYFVEKMFYFKMNVLLRKNLELILYLAGVRQIKNAISSFGMNLNILKNSNLLFCIITRNVKEAESLKSTIIKEFLAKELPLSINTFSIEKYKKIKHFYNFLDTQINCVLKAYDFTSELDILNSGNLEKLFLALNELACEKMVLLSLEKL